MRPCPSRNESTEWPVSEATMDLSSERFSNSCGMTIAVLRVLGLCTSMDLAEEAMAGWKGASGKAIAHHNTPLEREGGRE